jgi:hypothetical protein
MPTLSLDPTAAVPGQTISVTGSGFDPKAKFALTTVDPAGTESGYDANGAPTNINRPKRDGSFSVGINVPPVTGTSKVRAYQPLGTKVAEASIPVATVPVPPPVTSTTPALVTVAYRQPSGDSMPAYKATITDSTWKTHIRRITSSSGQRHAYSKVQPYNADNTKIMVRPNLLVDARTYDATSHSLPAEARWSSKDPDIIWGVVSGGAGFVRHRVSTGQSTTLRSFSGFGQLRIGTNEGNVDDNDRFVVLNEGAHFVVYDILNNTFTEHNLSQYGGLDNISISHSGEYIVAVWNASGSGRGQGMELLRRDATFVRQLTSHGGSHGDFARDAAGNDVWVVCNAPDMRAYRLDTAASTQLLPPTPAFARGHVSGRMSRRPGWAGFSDYGGLSGAAGYGQLALVKLDVSRQAEVYGFTHHYDDRGATYAAQPQACWNLDGTRVIFASNWGVSGGPVYDFEATA